MKRVIIGLAVLLSGIQADVFSGQNAGASIRIDFNYTTAGDQGQTSMPPPGVGVTVRLEIHVHSASNLDTYEFDLNYPSSDLTYVSAAEDNAVSEENNFLKKNGGSTIGFMATNYGSYINITNSLVGNQGENTPDGDGLLTYVRFTTKVASPGQLTFGSVKWYDNDGNIDLCTDKGDASLPVQMSNIQALADRSSGITIQWKTESEVDCAGFHVWRSNETRENYQRITTMIIPGHGNSSSVQEYSYIDKNTQEGVRYWYQIEEVSTEGQSEFHGPISVLGVQAIPQEFTLSQNYPNPFNPTTTFDYQLPNDSRVSIRVYNIAGECVRELVNEEFTSGYYQIIWDGKNDLGVNVTTGIYLVQMTAGEFRSIKKINLVK